MKYVGKKVFIRLLEEADAESLCNLFIRNKDFFQRFTPTREADYYTLEWQRSNIMNSMRQSKNDEKYAFGIFLKETEELIGNLNFTEVLRGCLQGCFIGYSLDEKQNGKGYMTEAIQLAVEFAFKELRLHRIEAGVMPHNLGSMRVLEKVGFHKEGIARKNVKINGKWEDHQVLAIISHDED